MTDETTSANGATASNDAIATPAPQPLQAAAAVSAPTSAPVSVPVPTAAPAPVIPAEGAGNASVPNPPAPAVAPVAGPDQKQADDIAHILEGVKLPERRTASEGAENSAPKEPRVFDTMLGATAARVLETNGAPVGTNPIVATPAVPAPSAETPAQPAGDIPRLHTLKDDLQGVVRDKKISLVRAVALEQEKKRGQGYAALPETPAHKTSSHRIVIIGLSIAAVLLIGGGAFAAYMFVRGAGAPAPAPQDASLLFAEKTVAFPLGTLSDVDIKRSLAQLRQSPGTALGTIIRVVPTAAHADMTGVLKDQPAAIGDFLQSVNAHVAPDLIRALSDSFFLGIHVIDKNAPVLVIPVSSYERAFAGMLAWEPTMNADLAPFFTAVPAQITGASGLPVTRQFQDAIISNYDARVLRDDSGAIELMYSFPSRGILIIAESPNSFGELLSRLRASRQL